MTSRSTGLAAATALLCLATACSSGSSKPEPSERSGGGSSSTSVPRPEPVTGKPGTITIGASGDLIAHAGTIKKAAKAAGGNGYAFDPFFTAVRPVVEAPAVAICQMEGPLSRTDTNLSVELSFNAPHEFATATRATGFDGCSTANNHTWDRGQEGMEATRAVLAENGLKAAGPGTSADHKGQPVFYEANGLKVAQLSYSYSLINAIGDQVSVPPSAPWLKDAMLFTRTATGIEQDAAAARARGADLVLVSMHWGEEYKGVNDEQKRLADELMKSGQVDWIIGNHPHVVQPCDKIDGRYVTYSLGNFFSGQDAAYLPGTADGAFASVTFTRDKAGTWTQSMTYQPTYQNQKTRQIELATPAWNPVSYAKTSKTMGLLGCDAKPET